MMHRTLCAAALAAALAAGCGNSNSDGGDLDRFGYIGTVLSADAQCANAGIVPTNDFTFELVSGATQLTDPGANCLAVFFGVGTLRDLDGGFERSVTFDLAVDLGVASCAQVGTLTGAALAGRPWTLVKTEDDTTQELQCAGAGVGGTILDPGNPVALSAACTLDGTPCDFQLQGGLFATFNVLSAILAAPVV